MIDLRLNFQAFVLPSIYMTAETAVMLDKKVIYLGEFGYLNSSCIKSIIERTNMAAVGHGLSRSAILVLLVLLSRILSVINDLGPCVSLGGTFQSAFVPGRFLMFPGNVSFSGSLAGPANWTQHRLFNAQRVGFFGFSAIVYWIGLQCTHKNLWSCEHAGMCCCKKCQD